MSAELSELQSADQLAQLTAARISQINRRRRRRKIEVWVWRVVILAVLLGAWQLSSGRLVANFVISSPSQVWDQLDQWVRSGYIISNTAVTLEETALGFVIGVVIGSALGLIFGLSTRLSDVFAPFIDGAYALPKIMLGPLFVVWFGIDIKMKVFLSALFVVFIVFYNIWNGVREVDPDLVEILEVMGASKLVIVREVYLPSALTWLFNSLRLAFPIALIGAIVGEYMASSEGLGYVATNAATENDTAGVFVAVIVVTITAVIVDHLLVLLQRAVNRRYGRVEGGRLVI